MRASCAVSQSLRRLGDRRYRSQEFCSGRAINHTVIS
jgi:hypothetical protein